MQQLMRYFIVAFMIIIFLPSCADYATIKAIKNSEEKIALQDYYSPCCGSCAQRMVIDDRKGHYTALQVDCELTNMYSARCSPFGIGTQKQIMTYKMGKINSLAYYRPVYDTIELLKLFPRLPRESYIDTSLRSKPILALTTIDSILIAKYLNMAGQTNCNGKYVSLIRGYIYVGNADMKLGRQQKIKFKTKNKDAGN